MLLVAVALAAALLVLFVREPLPADSGDGARLLDRTGEVEFAQLTTEFSRTEVSISQVPDHTVRAVLAAEDADFYAHPGISIPGVVRALVANLRDGEVTQGGSTITQQYIKVVSEDDARTVWRKIREAALAVKLERSHSKAEILERYLNTVYFGRGAYGIQAAAQAYFDADVEQLTLSQSAVLVGLLPAPAVYDPLVDVEAAHARYRYVLGRMVEEGWLETHTRNALLSVQPPTVPRRVAARDDAPWFTSLVSAELAELGFADARGLQITTTLNLGVQHHAERAYAEAFMTTPAPGALVAVTPRTGGILAVVGGKDYARDQFNLAIAERQPGSTFKTFALAAWLAEGGSPEDVFEAPANVTIPRGEGHEDWTVANYGGVAYGALSLREATWKSSNTVYAQVAAQLGADRLASTATDMMGRQDQDAFAEVPSLVLGTEEVSPLDLVSGYAVLAAEGVRHATHTVTEVRRGSQVLYRAPAEGQRVLDAEVANLTTAVLRGVISEGTGRAAAIGRPAAGKTGTTQDHGDAWFVGYTPQVAAVVWMGNRDDRASLPGAETGGGLPARTWASFMGGIHEGVEVADFPAPAGGRFGQAGIQALPGSVPTAASVPSSTPSVAATEDATPVPVTPAPTGSRELPPAPTEPAAVPPPEVVDEPQPRPEEVDGAPPPADPTPQESVATAPPQPSEGTPSPTAVPPAPARPPGPATTPPG